MLAPTAEERRAMGEASYARCAQHFGWPKVTERFLDLFATVAKR